MDDAINIIFDKNTEYNRLIWWELYKKYINSNQKIKDIEDLKKWLENPPGTNLNFDIDKKVYFGEWFHDQFFVIHKHENSVEFFGTEENIACKNCKFIYLNSVNKEITNDYELIKIEGYSDIGVSTNDGKVYEYYLETVDDNRIILETNKPIVSRIKFNHNFFLKIAKKISKYINIPGEIGYFCELYNIKYDILFDKISFFEDTIFSCTDIKKLLKLFKTICEEIVIDNEKEQILKELFVLYSTETFLSEIKTGIRYCEEAMKEKNDIIILGDKSIMEKELATGKIRISTSRDDSGRIPYLLKMLNESEE